MAYCNVLNVASAGYICFMVPFEILCIVTIFSTKCSGSYCWAISTVVTLFCLSQFAFMVFLCHHIYWDMINTFDAKKRSRDLVAATHERLVQDGQFLSELKEVKDAVPIPVSSVINKHSMAYCNVLNVASAGYICFMAPFEILCIVAIFSTKCSGSYCWVISTVVTLFCLSQFAFMVFLCHHVYRDMINTFDAKKRSRDRLVQDRQFLSELKEVKVAVPIPVSSAINKPNVLKTTNVPGVPTIFEESV